jgi:hypothetical protein
MDGGFKKATWHTFVSIDGGTVQPATTLGNLNASGCHEVETFWT